MQTVGMPGLKSYHGPEKVLRFDKPASLIMPDGVIPQRILMQKRSPNCGKGRARDPVSALIAMQLPANW